MKKIVFCYTLPVTLNFATSTIRKLVANGWDVVVVSSDEEHLKEYAEMNNVSYYCVNFSRGYNIWSDFRALFKLGKFLRSYKPDVVVGATPKAGLLSMLASKMVGIPLRIYHIFGFPFETATKLKRMLLLNVERVAAACATNVLPISLSIGKVCLKERISRPPKLCMSYKLTIGGVDMTRFNVALFDQAVERKHCGFGVDDIVIGFVGRLTRDKGIYDFIEVVQHLQGKYSNIQCVVIGDNDSRCPIDIDQYNAFIKQCNVLHIPYTAEIERYYSVMDILLLPSYREGFGNANVEAQAMKVPVVCYDVTGCRDSVNSGVTGIAVTAHNIMALESATEQLILDVEARKTMGVNGKLHVANNFTTEIVAANNMEYIFKLVQGL